MATTSPNIMIPNYLKADTTEKNLSKATVHKVELKLNGQTIHSLKELREHFNAEELMKYHMEGQLLPWLAQHYYENEATIIEDIDFQQTDCIRRLCGALGINYMASQNMTDEEKSRWDERKRIVSEYTTDPAILSELWLVAMNQEELAELLNQQEKKIYLCKESFSIPIRVAGVEYIGIGNATIENPYTKSQLLIYN